MSWSITSLHQYDVYGINALANETNLFKTGCLQVCSITMIWLNNSGQLDEKEWTCFAFD